jgi:hypothetical protein
MFDLDYPGHYMRRIKNVTFTIPCITGPYTGVHCRLTLLSSMTRIDPRVTSPQGNAARMARIEMPANGAVTSSTSFANMAHARPSRHRAAKTIPAYWSSIFTTSAICRSNFSGR